MKKSMCCCSKEDLAKLILRLGLGVIFIVHGYMKIVKMAMTVGFFASLGLPTFIAYLVAWIELLGGIAMLMGVCTRLFGWLLAIIMAGAIYFTYSMGFVGGYELPFVVLVMAVTVAMGGAGKYAIGQKECKKCQMGKDECGHEGHQHHGSHGE